MPRAALHVSQRQRAEQMFSPVPCASSWTGVFNQDRIQEAANVFPDPARASATPGVWQESAAGVQGTRRNFRSSFSLQTAFNNRKHITRRIRLTVSARPLIPH